MYKNNCIRENLSQAEYEEAFQLCVDKYTDEMAKRSPSLSKLKELSNLMDQLNKMIHKEPVVEQVDYQELLERACNV